MANEPELRGLHESIDASSEEMARYRARLAATLENPASSSTPSRWLLAAVTPAAIALILWLTFAQSGPRLEQEHLDELQTFVSATDAGTLDRLARKAETGKSEIGRHNANMLVCLASPDGTALQQAALGATTDPRADFRAWYLEYLLDHAESYQLDSDRIEQLMESESDAACLDLWARLLDLAETAAATTI